MASSGEAIKNVTESTGMSGNLDTSSSLHFSSRIDEYPRKLTVVELFVLILFYFGYVKFGFPAVWSRTFFDLESAAADTNQDMRRCDRTRKKTTAKACKKYDKKLYLILRHESLDISYLGAGYTFSFSLSLYIYGNPKINYQFSDSGIWVPLLYIHRHKTKSVNTCLHWIPDLPYQASLLR